MLNQRLGLKCFCFCFGKYSKYSYSSKLFPVCSLRYIKWQGGDLPPPKKKQDHILSEGPTHNPPQHFLYLRETQKCCLCIQEEEKKKLSIWRPTLLPHPLAVPQVGGVKKKEKKEEEEKKLPIWRLTILQGHMGKKEQYWVPKGPFQALCRS